MNGFILAVNLQGLQHVGQNVSHNKGIEGIIRYKLPNNRVKQPRRLQARTAVVPRQQSAINRTPP